MFAKRFIDIEKIERHYRIEEDGSIFSFRKQKYLKSSFNTAGYLFVCLTTDEKPRFFAVHRIVATKYLGECPPKLETSHKDGDKLNNHYTNLEYISHSANILKSYREHGREPSEHLYHKLPYSYETKRKIGDANKKEVLYINNGIETIFPSIADTAILLNSYSKKIYRCLHKNMEFTDKHHPENNGFLYFLKDKK